MRSISWALRLFTIVFFIEASVVLPVFGSPPSLLDAKMIFATDGPELEYLLDLSLRVMLDKPLYTLINETFKAEKIQTDKTVISESKIIYILSQIKSVWKDIETYLKSNDQGNKSADVTQFSSVFEAIAKDPKIAKIMSASTTIAQPIMIVNKTTKQTFNNLTFYANHPRYEIPTDAKSKVIPADNHRQVMIDLVDSAKPGDRLFFNFYDFDLPELADAFVRAHKRKVEIVGGIDKKVFDSKEDTSKAIKTMLDQKIQVELVDSVGLNHQKIIALIRKNGVSQTLFSSGNATQSCSGPEGDLKMVPANKRPKESIPNPNHMILVDGVIPALIAAAEIKKNVVYKLRGQSAFPISGGFQLVGPLDEDGKNREGMLLAFSPNGGLGDINRDIFSKFLSQSTGPIEGAVFSFSSIDLGKVLVESVVTEIKRRRKMGKPATNILKEVIDAGFAMRDYSIFLNMAGYQLIEFDPNDPFAPVKTNPSIDPEQLAVEPVGRSVETTKVFVEDLNGPYVKPIKSLLTTAEWANWRSNLRMSPDWFKPSSFEWNGQKIPTQVKLHDKVIILPEMNISNAGSSINFSAGGETNQEQISIIQSTRITRSIRGAVKWIWQSMSSPEFAIDKEAVKRNEQVSKADQELALKVMEHRKPNTSANSCLRLYKH